MNCTFCRIIRREESALIVYEDDEVIAFLDKHPQTRGHLQLVPKIHVRWLYELADIGTFFVTAKKIIRVIIPALGADHVTMATFGYQVAHAHLWLVPQYETVTEISEDAGDKSGIQGEVAELLKSVLNPKFRD